MMKNKLLPIAVIAAFLGLSACVSSKILTPEAINSDISMDQLAMCQFYISKNVTLNYAPGAKREVLEISGEGTTSGVARVRNVNIRSTITINRKTPGILQTKNNAGEVLQGYAVIPYIDSKNMQLNILFDSDDDNVICFTAIWDVANDKFELISNDVIFDGLPYTIEYKGEEMPYLKYKLIEETMDEKESRKAPGRKVGS